AGVKLIGEIALIVGATEIIAAGGSVEAITNGGDGGRRCRVAQVVRRKRQRFKGESGVGGDLIRQVEDVLNVINDQGIAGVVGHGRGGEHHRNVVGRKRG